MNQGDMWNTRRRPDVQTFVINERKDTPLVRKPKSSRHIKNRFTKTKSERDETLISVVFLKWKKREVEKMENMS